VVVDHSHLAAAHIVPGPEEVARTVLGPEEAARIVPGSEEAVHIVLDQRGAVHTHPAADHRLAEVGYRSHLAEVRRRIVQGRSELVAVLLASRLWYRKMNRWRREAT
jgi:hypothetical protein